MRRLILFFILVFLISPLEAVEGDFIHVTIDRAAVEVLQGWPLDRRWYAVAIRNLASAGARRIFIDIAFPFADVGHPESDEFFFHELRQRDNAFLLCPEESLVSDSVAVLGSYKLPNRRFFTTFSSIFKLEHDMLSLTINETPSLVSALLQNQLAAPRSVLIAFPDSDLAADYSFLQVVQSAIPCNGRDVIIALDYPGVTSYLLTQTNQRQFSTTQIQLRAVKKMRAGEYLIKWPAWLTGLLMMIGVTPLMLAFFTNRKRLLGVLSFALCTLAFVSMKFADIYLGSAWLAILLLPASTVAFACYRKAVSRHMPPSIAQPESHPQPLASANSEIHELQYKLKFYEHLQDQLPPSEIEDATEKSGIIYHRDSPLKPLLQKAQKIAETDVPVMLFGESGTGKEMLAQFIHRSSSRSSRLFVAINCGSFNENLIESELFGHEAGAFTGAQKLKIGRFEVADGGTLFLDEIGETSPAVQVKLLRVLQEGSFERVGGTQSVRVSVRIVTATHQDLREAIESKNFRADLFYRLNGISLTIPPLRERTMDVPPLFRSIVFAKNPEMKISQAVIDWLQMQTWSGNVRELKTAIERALINAQLKSRKFFLPADFELQNARETPSDNHEELSQQILNSLRRHEFKHRSISAVAAELSVHRVTVTEYLRGWIIRFMVQHDLNLDQVCRELNGSPIILNGKQLEERVQKYITGIHDRIRDGVAGSETDSEIRLGRFKNLPGAFDDDLAQLVKRLRK
jgi:DNA-binding NtrC family response regulator